MKRVRKHLTYANVMTTILAFVVLAGGSAFAASQLAKNSVGKKQLKANAVTTAKIKKAAVTKAKIKDGAVDGAKVADGSLTETDINAAATPFAQIVYEARGNATVAVTKGPLVPYPLNNGSYTQEAGRSDLFTGAIDLTYDPGCTPPRSAAAVAYLDPPDPSKLANANIVAIGVATDETGAKASQRISMGPYFGGSFRPAAPTSHNIVLGIQLQCTAGDGAKATFGAVDVLGVK